MFKFKLTKKDIGFFKVFKSILTKDKVINGIIKKLDNKNSLYNSAQKSYMCVFAHQTYQYTKDFSDKKVSNYAKNLWKKLRDTKSV